MKRGTPEHPKIKQLARLLDVSRATAVGTLEMLTHFAARYAIQGDVGRWPDAELAEAVDWRGDPARLIAALLEVRLLDVCCAQHRLLIHDWADHADDSVRKTLKKRGLPFLTPDHSRIVPDAFANDSGTIRDSSEENRSASGSGSGSGSKKEESTAARAGTVATVDPGGRYLSWPPALVWSAVQYREAAGSDPDRNELALARDALRVDHDEPTYQAHFVEFCARMKVDPQHHSLKTFRTKFNAYRPGQSGDGRRGTQAAVPRPLWAKAPRRLREIADYLERARAPRCDPQTRELAEQELAALRPTDVERAQAEKLIAEREAARPRAVKAS